MTVPATPQPQKPAARPVLLRVTEEALLDILRLPEGTHVQGAQAVHYPAPALVLYLEMAGVPDGADEVWPAYERDTSVPDPVRLTTLTWLHDGDEVGRTVVDGDGNAT